MSYAPYSPSRNQMNHGRYSLAEPTEMLDGNKNLFHHIADAFLNKYQFDLPAVLNEAVAGDDI